MKLLLIRHGDPDYEHDTLTERGWKEAELLSRRMVLEPADHYYMSCLGRAKDTASCTMQKLGRAAIELPWLQEFQGRAYKPDIPGEPSLAWDWMPKDWTVDARFYDRNTWTEPKGMTELNAKERYDWVCKNFDALLEEHGYQRNGNYYNVIRPNEETLVFFCHFAVGCVLISHLLNVSPMILWHGLCAAPTSVTKIVTEEREKGIASFRMLYYGDTSHLTENGMEPAFSARFCECYDNTEQRH